MTPSLSFPTTSLKKNLVIATFTLTAIVSTITAVLLANPNPPPLLSPLGTAKHILGLETSTNQQRQVVFGFLPYWNFSKLKQLPLDNLTHLSLFGITPNPDGTFQTREQNYPEPGWRALNSPQAQDLIRQATQAGVKPILVITGFDNDTIESVISHPTHTRTLISRTLDFIDQHHYQGVNIDFEYTSKATPKLRKDFTNFISQLNQALKDHNPSLELSIDVFADAASKNRIWDITSLTPNIDHLFIMAYDFHRPSSPVAGPVSPLYGAGTHWQEDITKLLKKHLEQSPPSKIVLGLPFYGYEWRTDSSRPLSPTIKGTGATATYRRVKDIIAQHSPTIFWHDSSLSPWLVYQENGQTYQIHYDDARSLRLKRQLATQLNLAGVGVWALGYEGAHPELWQALN